MSDRRGWNKQTALDFYDLMFNQCRTADAIEKYAGTTSRWASSTDLIYVPMPPFHSKSTGAQDGRISSGGVNARIESASRRVGTPGERRRRQERTWRCGPTLPRPR